MAQTQGRAASVSPWIHSLTYQFIYSESVDESNNSPPHYISIRQATESDTGQRGEHSYLENAPSDELPESAGRRVDEASETSQIINFLSLNILNEILKFISISKNTSPRW